MTLIYDGNFNLDNTYNTLSDKFVKMNIVFCVGMTLDNKTIVYINKRDYKVFHDIGINDNTGVLQNPQLYKFKTARNPGAVEK